jgi:phosphatidylserine/phosphatidylglycerophosphate/cardiolipin synthase-like enzyme
MSEDEKFTAFATAAGEAVARLGPERLREIVMQVDAGAPHASLLLSASGADAYFVRALLAAHADAGTEAEVAMRYYLRGLIDGYARQEARCQADTVWSGPTTHEVPVQSTASVLISLIAEARRELVLMTYSAKPYQPLREALAAAAARRVAITVVVETLQGAGSAISGSEPASAFANLPGVELWHWPAARRAEAGAKQHAKLAAADRTTLLVTSANLTASGASKNIEAGILVRGGTSPARAVEHVRRLQMSGELQRL